MEKKTVAVVIGGIFLLALLFILLAIFVSESKLKPKMLHLSSKPLNSSSCPADFDPLPLILVSMDGFRPDYMNKAVNPFLQQIIEGGVHAPYMATSFPSSTFPNHYSIVTGLYPESHGVIANHFYDSETNESFSFKTDSVRDGKWWAGEPIWNTVHKVGQKSATFFWPGSEAPIGGEYPDYYKKYDKKISFESRVDQVLKWLKLPAEERPSYISLYFNQPDWAGHSFGPGSDEVTQALSELDLLIEKLFQGLIDNQLLNCVNVIFVSDHGMAKSGKEKVINLKKEELKLNDDEFSDFIGGASAFLRLNQYNSDHVRLKLLGVL